MTHPNRRDLFRAGAVGLGSAALASASVAPLGPPAEGSFHFDHVLGTSLDGWVVGPVEQAEAAALSEIERLRKVFSLHDADSELSRLNRAAGPFAASADLLAVLRLYETWCERTGGAMNPQVGGLVRAWDTANGSEPDAAALSRAVKRIQSAGWTVEGNTVTRHTDQPLNLNSIAKGHILQQAAAAMKAVPGVTAGLLDLGGDLAAWGTRSWALGVQDPFSPTDNAPLLSRLAVREESVATSGGYLRTYTADGKKHSHILDPRTGRPADCVAGATVIAADSTTANVLATALCVLGADAGLKLAVSMNAAALVIDADGREHRTANFARYELPVGADEPKKPEEKKAEPKKDEKKGEAWPEDYEVTVSFELPTPSGGKARRPYVAFWVEDADGKAVRTVAVWGNSPKWLPTMSGWWKIGKEFDNKTKQAVCRATRAPGKYDLTWDGKDDAGKALPQGTYTIKLEVHREHGKDVTQSAKIKCGTADEKETMAKNAETEESTVKYAKKEKKKDK